MKSLRKLFRCTVGCGVTLIFSSVLAAAAATPAPNTHTVAVGGKTSTYANLPGAPAATDATAAYEFRTRILVGKPGCQRFATDADNVFLNDKIDISTQAAQLKKIGADAAAAGCLGS